MRTKTPNVNKSTKESIAIYGGGMRELLKASKEPQEEWGAIWSSDEDKHEGDPELQWFLGWFMGVADALDTMPEELITLSETPAKKKKAPAKKKAPVKKAVAKKKKAPAKKKAPVKKKKATA